MIMPDTTTQVMAIRLTIMTPMNINPPGSRRFISMKPMHIPAVRMKAHLPALEHVQLFRRTWALLSAAEGDGN